jgi:hypothetical protein
MARQRTAVDPSAELYVLRCHRWLADHELHASPLTKLNAVLVDYYPVFYLDHHGLVAGRRAC